MFGSSARRLGRGTFALVWLGPASAFWAVAGSPAQAQEPTQALIAAAKWRATEYKVISLRWSEKRTVPKAATERLLNPPPPGVDPRGANLDVKVTMKLVLENTGRVRFEAAGELPALQGGKIQPTSHDSVAAFDGTVLKTYVPPGQAEHGQGFVTRQTKPPYAEPKFWPVLVFYQWFSRSDLPPPLDCQPDTLGPPAASVVDGRSLLTFRHTYKSPRTKTGQYCDFVVDPAESYRVVRIDQYSAGTLAAKVSIEYGSQGGATVPIGWTAEQFRPRFGLVETVRVDVIETRLNPVVGDGEFSFAFPPGTRVVDADTGDVSIVKGDASERKVTVPELEQELSNAEILENDARQSARRWRWLASLTVAIVVIALATLGIWRRMRSRSRKV